MRTKISIGDVYEIRLSNLEYAYATVIAYHDLMGYLIRVFRYRGKQKLSVDEFVHLDELFAPVFCNFKAGLKDHSWRLLAKRAITAEPMPRFRATSALVLDINDDSWAIWDGEHFREKGKLSEKDKDLEEWSVWGHLAIDQRILNAVI